MSHSSKKVYMAPRFVRPLVAQLTYVGTSGQAKLQVLRNPLLGKPKELWQDQKVYRANGGGYDKCSLVLSKWIEETFQTELVELYVNRRGFDVGTIITKDPIWKHNVQVSPRGISGTQWDGEKISLDCDERDLESLLWMMGYGLFTTEKFKNPKMLTDVEYSIITIYGLTEKQIQQGDPL